MSSSAGATCGTIAPRFAALNRILRQTISCENGFFAPLKADVGDFAWQVILTNEWGHHEQRMPGLGPTPGNAYELWAGGLAGAHASDTGAGVAHPGDVSEAVTSSASACDPIWLRQDQQGAHDTVLDRIPAFMHGCLADFPG